MSAAGHHATISAERAKSALPSASEIRAALRTFGFVPIVLQKSVEERR
jgi:hypothetical protein